MREYNLRHNKTDTDRARKYTLWDADKTTACECDEGWMGYDCSQRQCVFGDDPLSYGVRLPVWVCVPICVLLACCWHKLWFSHVWGYVCYPADT